DTGSIPVARSTLRSRFTRRVPTVAQSAKAGCHNGIRELRVASQRYRYGGFSAVSYLARGPRAVHGPLKACTHDMNGPLTWDESHFDQMSWHDSHVHGVHIREGNHGCGDLELDIDYIL